MLRRFANDPRPEVRECMFPIREGKDSWIQLIAPVNDSCPDNGEIFCEVVRTLLDKAPVRRKLVRQLAHFCVDAFRLMVIRGDEFFVRVSGNKRLFRMVGWVRHGISPVRGATR